MYQREFLYLGFNEDESKRKVFDGVTIYSAATHRLFANVQFAHPTYFSGQDQHHDYTSNSIAPLTFAVRTDPISGIRDGILKRPATDPLRLPDRRGTGLLAVEGIAQRRRQPGTISSNSAKCSALLPEWLRAHRCLRSAEPADMAPDSRAGVCRNLTQGGNAISVTPRALTVRSGSLGRSGYRAAKKQLSRHQAQHTGLPRRVPRGIPEYPGCRPADGHEYPQRAEFRTAL